MSEIHEKLDGQTWWEMSSLEQVSTLCDISLSYSNGYFSHYKSFNIITLLSVCWLFMFIHVIKEIEHGTFIPLNFIFRNG